MGPASVSEIQGPPAAPQADERRAGRRPPSGVAHRRGPGRRRRRRGPLVEVGLWLALAIPLAVALVALAHPRWYPIGDLAQTEMRVRDVSRGHPPLIGLAGRLGPLDAQGSHPGPLSFYALWLFYTVFGSTAWALQAASVSVALVAMGGCLWVAHRRGGPRLALAVAALLAVLGHAYQSLVFVEAWNPYLPVMWWFLFLLAVWSVLCDDLVMLPVAVFAGSFALQTHISYLGLVGGVGAVAVVGLAVRGWRANDDPAARRELLRWGGGSAALFAALWAPVAVNQLTASPGNLTVLKDHFTDPPDQAIGLAPGLELFLVHLNPWRLLAGQAAATGAVLPGLALVAAWALAAAFSRRVGRPALVRLHVVVAAALVLGAVSAANILGQVWLYLVLWAWGTQALVLLAAGWTAAEVVSAQVPADRRAGAVRLGTGAVAVIGVVALAAFTVAAADAEVPVPRLSSVVGEVVGPTAAALADPAVTGEGRDGRYLVTWDDAYALGTQGFALDLELERRGFDVGVTEAHREGSTPHRVLPAADATAVVHLAVGAEIDRWRTLPGARQVAYADARTAAERAEYGRLRAEVAAALRAQGRQDEVPDIDRNLFGLALDQRLPPAPRDALAEMVGLGLPAAVFVGPPALAGA